MMPSQQSPHKQRIRHRRCVVRGTWHEARSPACHKQKCRVAIDHYSSCSASFPAPKPWHSRMFVSTRATITVPKTQSVPDPCLGLVS